MESSYAKNNYGEVFEAIVDAFKPNTIVELGILNGYSTFHLSKRLNFWGRGKIFAYDIFEDYPYHHAKYEDVKNIFADNSAVSIQKKDAWEVAADYSSNSVELLHVDLSNTGETVRRIMEQWDSRMVQGGVILFEGGTDESDLVEWRVKYNAPSIKKEIETNPIIQERYVYGTYLKWPGLTMLLKKR